MEKFKRADVAEEEVTSYQVFEDRAKSLLERWGKFRETNKSFKGIDALCMKGFLQEIDDEYTKNLMKS